MKIKIAVFSLVILCACAPLNNASTSNNEIQCSGPDVDKNLEDGEKFIKSIINSRKPIYAEPGYFYEIIRSGEGEKISSQDDQVLVHYELAKTSGEVVDSSYSRGRPAIFRVKDVIYGWSLALSTMKVGEIKMVYLPSALTYGCKGKPPKIGRQEFLVSKIELLEIVKRMT